MHQGTLEGRADDLLRDSHDVPHHGQAEIMLGLSENRHILTSLYHAMPCLVSSSLFGIRRIDVEGLSRER